MIVGLDTSVLVRLLTLDPPDLAQTALTYIQKCQASGDSVRVGDWVLAEAYYALQYHYGIPKEQVLESLHRFVTSPGIQASEPATTLLAIPQLAKAKPGFVDRLIHDRYLREGIGEMATFERSAAKLPRVRVLKAADPLL